MVQLVEILPDEDGLEHLQEDERVSRCENGRDCMSRSKVGLQEL